MLALIILASWMRLTIATPPATMNPRAETPFKEAALVADTIGEPVAVGAVATPVDAIVAVATPATPDLILLIPWI